MSRRSRLQINALVILLVVTGLSVTLYKKVLLGFPLTPGQYQDIWTVESKITFTPSEDNQVVSLALPGGKAGWRIVDEHFTSSGFNLSIDNSGDTPRATWERKNINDKPTLYYKLQIFRNSDDLPELPDSPRTRNIDIEQSIATSLQEIIKQAQKNSTPGQPMAALLVRNFNDSGIYNQLVANDKNLTRVDAIQLLLNLAEIPSQVIRGVQLEDGRRRQQLTTLLATYERGWSFLDPKTATVGFPEDFFVWQVGSESLLDVLGGRNSDIEFAIVKNSLPLKSVLLRDELTDDELVLDFSIYSLPVEQQGVFKHLLLIPVGALVVVLLRVIVGLRTSGTFMPILIALALMQTTLVTGLVIFLVVVGTGLWLRNYLSHLNLLLVSRVAAVVIMVLLLMVFISIISYKLGIDQALTVTFFPTIILSWTIERMSILWEEEGGHEVLVQGGGSLLSAVLAFFAMTNRYFEHLTFNFPELLLSLLGIIILLGNYSGYRLMELYRFRQLKHLKE